MDIQVTSGNIDDLARFGFNEVDQVQLISSDLVSTNALTASHDIKINDVAVGASTSCMQLHQKLLLLMQFPHQLMLQPLEII